MSHRNALTILEHEAEFSSLWFEIKDILDNVTDEALIKCFNKRFKGKNKSLSTTINYLLKEAFEKRDWQSESAIFQDTEYQSSSGGYWYLDFAKEAISIEVAFNHQGVIAWNLLKPVLASELNHVKKNIQTKIGVVICATNALKKAGNFDSAIGDYEKFNRHLKPLMNQLSVPLLIIGLDAPETFEIIQVSKNNRQLGEVKSIK